MPLPTPRDLHVNAALANISIAYRNASYIASQVFPTVPVQKKSDFYWQFDKSAWFRNDVKVRAPGTRSARTDYSVTSASYLCTEYSLAHEIPDEVYANADSAFRPAVEAVELITDGLLRAQELRVAALTVGGSALWANSSSPAVQWTSDSSDPYTDFDNAIANVVNTTGVMPNTVAMSYDTWRALRKHPDFLERIKYTRNDGVVNLNDMRQWFGVEKWLIGAALYDTAREGQPSSMAQIWGDGVWIGYVPMNAALLTPAAGYVFEWASRQIRTFRMDQERTDVFEVSHNLVEKITASDVGTVLYNVI